MIRKNLLYFVCAIGLLFCVHLGSASKEQSGMLFRVQGESNEVFLLGSIHMLRQEDYPLPANMERAYAEAETLVMELDMDDLNPMDLVQLFASSAAAGEGQTLESIMGPTAYAKAQKLAQPLGTNLELFNRFEPWFTAITIVNLQMNKLGFSENLGIEMHFLQRAGKDQKEILGLETAELQISIFDTLSPNQQRKLLLTSLEQAADLESDTADLISAWRNGDTEKLYGLLAESLEESPELYDQIVLQRNRNWIPALKDYLDDDIDYLVIVGAGHLVGQNSVVDLLRESGYEVSQH